jgi:hypothetical protein
MQWSSDDGHQWSSDDGHQWFGRREKVFVASRKVGVARCMTQEGSRLVLGQGTSKAYRLFDAAADLIPSKQHHAVRSKYSTRASY